MRGSLFAYLFTDGHIGKEERVSHKTWRKVYPSWYFEYRDSASLSVA